MIEKLMRKDLIKVSIVVVVFVVFSTVGAIIVSEIVSLF